MRRKAASAVASALLLASILTLAFKVQPAEATGTIYIKADGSVAPPTAPISSVDNVTYTFTDNIYDSIVVERGNIIVDGDRYTLQGTGSGNGFYWSEIDNVTVRNTNIRNFYYGISVLSSNHNSFSGNKITSNHGYGISLESCSDNSVSGNNVTDNEFGIAISYSDGNIVSGNNIASNSAIAIDILVADNNIISGNNATNSGNGIGLWDAQNNIVSGNNIAYNVYGIPFTWSSGNWIIGNNIANNSYGIEAGGYFNDNSAFYHNNFIGNTEQASAASVTSIWDDGYPSGGNYWSDYIARYPYAEEIDSSGIWDTPYEIDANEVDRYPLVNPSPHPPEIIEVKRIPDAPDYTDEVSVTAIVIDNATVDTSLLSYSYASQWYNVTMNRVDYKFSATIPAQPYGTFVQCSIFANDTEGLWAESELYSYIVEDFLPPEIHLSQTPDYPLPTERVKIYANVTEPVNASGVGTVFFHYRANSGQWWNTTMVLNETVGLYEATIFGYEKHDYVEYFVDAVDNAGNANATAIHHYEVLRCDANHNGIVDVYDIYMIGEAWESSAGEPKYSFDADIDENGIVDAQDLHLVNLQYGKDS